MADRRGWIAGYLNLFERRFDAWTAAPMASIEYTEAYEAAMMERSGRKLRSMSVGYIITQIDGKVGALHDSHALPLAYLRGADGRIVPSSLLAFTGSSMFVTIDAPFDGVLVVAQQLAPGWRAAIDGKDAETLRDGIFRAVRVTRGHHEITWRYRPMSLVVGACITILALVRLLLSIIFVKR